MGELYLPKSEREALKKIELDDLESIVKDCIRSSNPSGLYTLALESCGMYVADHLRNFEKAINAHSGAKSSRKRQDTDEEMRRAGDKLTFSVQQMQLRVRKEEEEEQFFCIYDDLFQPLHFNESLEVRLRYKWRKNKEEDWQMGMIVLQYTPDLRPDYSVSLPKRKPSAARLKQGRQEKLRREWEHLKLLSLHSLKEFFRDGGVGSDIPQSYRVTTNPYSHGLNNHSAKFWLQKPSTSH